MGERLSGTGPAGRTYSLELCGGTHVRRTGDIGLMVVTSEGASAAGIRRVEALTGEAAYAHLAADEQMRWRQRIDRFGADGQCTRALI